MLACKHLEEAAIVDKAYRLHQPCGKAPSTVCEIVSSDAHEVESAISTPGYLALERKSSLVGQYSPKRKSLPVNANGDSTEA